MNNESMDKTENNEEIDNTELTPNECDLYDLFINEYNDLFENILNLKGKNIYAIMKRNVFLLLGKTEFNKYSKYSMKKVYNKIKEEYFEPDNIVIKNLEDNLDSIGVRDLPTLNIDSIFAHCNKCYECTHMCGEPLYNYKYYDLVICIKCKMIYKKNMIRLFCTSCNEEYYSYIVNENNYKEDFFPATWDKYHCFSFNYEQMPCPECLAPLYYSEVKQLLKCFKCNWCLNPNNIKWICQICGKDFTSGVKEFVKFENKPEINCIKYGLINRINARPFKCKCCATNPLNTSFFHVGCGGTYYLSYLQTKVAIICSKCKTIQSPENTKWGCGNCKNSFNCDKIIILENNIENSFRNSVLETRTNFFLKESGNKANKINSKNENRVSSNDRYLTNLKKVNEKTKEVKSQKLKVKHRKNKEKKTKENEEKNVKRNLDNCLKTIDTTTGNSNDSNLLNKSKNINIKRKENLSNSSLEFYVLEKNTNYEKTEKEKEPEKEKEIIKIENIDNKESTNDEQKEKLNENNNNNIIEDIKKEEEKEKVNDNKEKEKENDNKEKEKEKDINNKEKENITNEKEKEKENEKDKNKKKKNQKDKNKDNKTKDKKLKKYKTNKEKSFNMKKKEEEEKKIINVDVDEEKEPNLESQILLENNEINEEKEPNNNIDDFAKKYSNNNLAKYNRRKNNINNILDKTNTKGQSQKKSKNIRLNVNLNININNIMDHKHNNNSIHSIKQVKSMKTLPSQEPYNIEPDENFNPDEFKIVEKIGFGSFGKIYNVRWIRNNKNYAMKIINLRYFEDIEDTQKKLQIVQDFLKKTHCPGVIKTYGSLYEKIGIQDYKYYILMELAQTDWEEEIKYRSKHNLYYSEDEVFNMIQQLVQCYSLLQKNNVSHRDVKPQNILILNGMYKVCDFGEARTISGKNGYIHQPIRGSELYMSPILFDALNSHRLDVLHNSYKSDVFSLGMCLFLAATLSFDSLYEVREEKSMKVIRKILEKYLIPHYSNYLVDILYHMLQVDEDMRPNFIELENLLFYSK